MLVDFKVDISQVKTDWVAVRHFGDSGSFGLLEKLSFACFRTARSFVEFRPSDHLSRISITVEPARTDSIRGSPPESCRRSPLEVSSWRGKEGLRPPGLPGTAGRWCRSSSGRRPSDRPGWPAIRPGAGPPVRSRPLRRRIGKRPSLPGRRRGPWSGGGRCKSAAFGSRSSGSGSCCGWPLRGSGGGTRRVPPAAGWCGRSSGRRSPENTMRGSG
mmetsp:Transcript_15308/g.35476  ORF Transcript_15308/g.35476 Transcript_15308/m.35476 type:complete len:215 (+) Transcript_15308:109-753(+)